MSDPKSKGGTPESSSKGTEVELKGEFVQTTPLGLSEEQMKTSNPQAVDKISKEAAESAVASDRQRLAELKAAFADDPAYALEAHEAGLTVEGAIAAKYPNVVEENAKLKEENAKLAKAAEEGTIEYSASDGEETTDKSADPTEAAAKVIWGKDEKLRAEFNGHFADFYALYEHEPGEFAA